jgi:hypothetical protein
MTPLTKMALQNLLIALLKDEEFERHKFNFMPINDADLNSSPAGYETKNWTVVNNYHLTDEFARKLINRLVNLAEASETAKSTI